MPCAVSWRTVAFEADVHLMVNERFGNREIVRFYKGFEDLLASLRFLLIFFRGFKILAGLWCASRRVS